MVKLKIKHKIVRIVFTDVSKQNYIYFSKSQPRLYSSNFLKISQISASIFL